MYSYAAVCLSVWQYVSTARFAGELSLFLWSFVSPVWKPEHPSTENTQRTETLRNYASTPAEASRSATCPRGHRTTNVSLNPSTWEMGRGRKSSYDADIGGLGLSTISVLPSSGYLHRHSYAHAPAHPIWVMGGPRASVCAPLTIIPTQSTKMVQI
jgi:hypothetical protein